MTTLEWIESVLASIVVLVLAALVRIAFKQESKIATNDEKIKHLEEKVKRLEDLSKPRSPGGI